MLVFHSGTSLINTKKRRFVHILPSIGAKSLFFLFHYVADQYRIRFFPYMSWLDCFPKLSYALESPDVLWH